MVAFGYYVRKKHSKANRTAIKKRSINSFVHIFKELGQDQEPNTMQSLRSFCFFVTQKKRQFSIERKQFFGTLDP